jgi:murein L,D-transpeptidase YafK
MDAVNCRTLKPAWPARSPCAFRALGFFALFLLASCAQRPEPPQASLVLPTKVDQVLVLKAQHRLYLMRRGTVLESFPVALGKSPIGPKTRAGDMCTPEGTYVLDWRNPNSQFYRAIHISYPNAGDLVQAQSRGVSAGGDIEIHGLPPGYEKMGDRQAATDWTDGCIAVTNEEMDLIWRMVEDNTPIEIQP